MVWPGHPRVSQQLSTQQSPVSTFAAICVAVIVIQYSLRLFEQSFLISRSSYRPVRPAYQLPHRQSLRLRPFDHRHSLFRPSCKCIHCKSSVAADCQHQPPTLSYPLDSAQEPHSLPCVQKQPEDVSLLRTLWWGITNLRSLKLRTLPDDHDHQCPVPSPWRSSHTKKTVTFPIPSRESGGRRKGSLAPKNRRSVTVS